MRMVRTSRRAKIRRRNSNVLVPRRIFSTCSGLIVNKTRIDFPQFKYPIKLTAAQRAEIPAWLFRDYAAVEQLPASRSLSESRIIGHLGDVEPFRIYPLIAQFLLREHATRHRIGQKGVYVDKVLIGPDLIDHAYRAYDGPELGWPLSVGNLVENRSEDNTSELQSLMRNSIAVCY